MATFPLDMLNWVLPSLRLRGWDDQNDEGSFCLESFRTESIMSYFSLAKGLLLLTTALEESLESSSKELASGTFAVLRDSKECNLLKSP